MYMEMDGMCSYIELMFLNPCLTEAIWLDASLEVGLVSSGLDSGMMSVSDMPAPGQPSHLPTSAQRHGRHLFQLVKTPIL